MSRDPSYVLGRMFGSIPEPTSAYDALIQQMYHAEGGFIWSEEEARTLVDAVLSEAAEAIRSSEYLRSYTDDHTGDCNEAADAIDSDVEETT